MAPRSTSSNGQWPPLQPQRRPNDSTTSSPTSPSNEGIPPQEMARISERLTEIERLMQRRLMPANQGSTISANPNLASSGPRPNAQQLGSHVQAPNAAFAQSHSHLPVQPQTVLSQNAAPAYQYAPPHSPIPAPPVPSNRPNLGSIPLVPPPPYMDDIFRDFSLSPQQEYLALEARLYQRINFQSKVRLGYGRTIAVLQRELEGGQEYEKIIRPYQIDQPDNLPELSPLIPNSEARLFADTVRALVDIIGLQRSCHLLENAKIEEVPGIRYEIQRVIIPSKAIPIPLEPGSFGNIGMAGPMMADVGPYAHGLRPGSSASSNFSTTPTMFSWTNGEGNLSPQQPPSSTIIDRELTSSPVSEPLHQSSRPTSPPRGILRRNSSGTSSVNGKRVTIQTELDYCPPFYDDNSPSDFGGVLTPLSSMPTSPIRREDGQSHQMQGNSEFQQLAIPKRNTPTPIKAEDGVLQQMAAAQM
jgi:hypothetical protein